MTLRRFSIVCLLSLTSLFANAQKSKVQAAWRALSDYEETLKDGRPNVSLLNKANEAIDLALANEDTKNQTRTHAYKLRIAYALFQYNLSEEIKKLGESIANKDERALVAYGNADLTQFETASNELSKIKDIDAKYLESIQESYKQGGSNLDEDELKLATAVQQMKVESANIASGQYKAKKYDQASTYFYKTAVMNSILFGTLDTSNFYNACVSAGKANNRDKIMEYNKKMIDAKISTPYNFEALHEVQLQKGDSTAAEATLKQGRTAHPDDIGLLTQETNLFLARGRQQEALNNLKISVEKDPNNALYYSIIGSIYDNMAHPRDPKTKKELPRPSNFDELFSNAEKNYLRSIELKPAKQEYLYNSLYNLGAMYNNYGGALAAGAVTGSGAKSQKEQKEFENRAQEYYKKAIPYLEQALAIKSDDKNALSALRKLYLLTGNDVKAKEIDSRMKAAGH